MTLFTSTELNSILQPFCKKAVPNVSFTGITFDSRLVGPGDLFIALAGQQQDGHHFVKHALEKGAAGALVTQLPDETIDPAKIIQVSNVYQALKALSAHARERSQATIAAITGSVGKTTVKEGLGYVLSCQENTVKSPKTYNNDLGVALSLVHLKPDTRFGVFEIGMNQQGEIAPLTAAIAPHIAIITAIGPVHIEYLKTIEAIALEKASIFSGVCGNHLLPAGAALIPQDSPFINMLKAQAQLQGIKRIVTFGQQPESQFYLKNIQNLAVGQRLTAIIDQKEIQYTLSLSGRHNALNSLAILAACSVMGADVERAAHDLENFLPVSGRGKVHKISYKGADLTIIDESRNANVLSMSAALMNFAAFPNLKKNRKIAILGDMRELGPYSEDHHQQIGDLLIQLKIDKVAVCGPAMEKMYQKLLPSQKFAHAASAPELLEFLKKTIYPGDILMVKGSLSMKMKQIITYFKENN